ncbi:MAG: hypothetical protein KF832_13745 [Caldilineaceae bacterium]|nr:hypothetical protein [Caldilineaceae bacterium]
MCKSCGGAPAGNQRGREREARPIAIAEQVAVNVLVPLPYSVLLPMALLKYVEARRLSLHQREATLPLAVAVWLAGRGVVEISQ